MSDASALPIAVVVSQYNRSITDSLLDGARRAFLSRGGAETQLEIVSAPGAFELPALCMAVAATERFAGALALGCIIKGETSHDRYIADAITHGLVEVTLSTGMPVALGVLTVDTPQQALDRAGGAHGNKGEEAMHALLDTINEMERLFTGGQPEASKHEAAPQRAIADKAARTREAVGGKTPRSVSGGASARGPR